MPDPTLNSSQPLNPPSALYFWERGRIFYNALLSLFVLLWIILTWPHFQTALTFSSLGKMLVLALLGNLCYCAAYAADFLMHAAIPVRLHRRLRWTIWIFGTLLALLFENYWIGDEIYPDFPQASTQVAQGLNAMTPPIASNMNFPAPLAIVGFLAAGAVFFLALASAFVFWFARQPRFARRALLVVGSGAVVYLALLFGFSASSRSTTLARGQEKYFCEIDCHLAYSVLDAKPTPGGRYEITLRTRFDETTTSPTRPKDAPLTPSPREVRLIDAAGHEYAPISIAGAPLSTPLKPADSYSTQLEFNIPPGATSLKLLINTVPAWPDRLVIGDENSWLHRKTYLAL
ncbi:MAG: hypothetical protein ABSE62_16975 [Chthoniobacteraceae bacterium]|jgi:hypothetical protein